jgi:hypothetical protein
MPVRSSIALLLLLTPLAGAEQAPAPPDAQALVNRALANELRAAQDPGHPMRYTLHKTSPRLSSTKLLIETKDGLVARLIAINDQPLSAEDEKKEQERLDGLLNDSGRQRHRKQGEDADTGRALKVLRALPHAFLYEYAGTEPASPKSQASVLKFTFKPNPDFDPPDLETEVLTAMTGAIWIDPVEERVTRLEGHLEREVDFGWGILGRLNKGGSITIEQADEGDHQWRIVHFQMEMTGRMLFKTRVFDTTEIESGFAPVPASLDYRKAIEMLRGSQAQAAH